MDLYNNEINFFVIKLLVVKDKFLIWEFLYERDISCVNYNG